MVQVDGMAREQPESPLEGCDISSGDDSGCTPAPPEAFPSGVSSRVPVDEANLAASIADLKASIQEVRQLIHERLADDEVKAKAFDRLYADLDRNQVEQEFERAKPLYLDLILLFDRLSRGIEDCAAEPGVDSPAAFLTSLQEELLEILRRREVDIIDPSPLVFDATLQRAVGVVHSAEQPNNSVAQVVRRGFVFRRRLVRAEEVVVNRSAPSSPALR